MSPSGLVRRAKSKLHAVLRKVGLETDEHWVRVVMYRECFAFLRALGPETLDVLEISGGNRWRTEFEFGSYTNLAYPEFDICSQTLERQFDVIIADQVFEHLKWPYRAGRNVLAMLKPGRFFIVTTPFLIRVHRVPIDCSRWTEEGLSYLLQECGFPASAIETGSWGNRACAEANFRTLGKAAGPFRSLANEPDFPVTVWAFAQKPSG